MSTTSWLLLLLLCLCLHACNARRLVADNKNLEKIHVSNQSVQKDISVAPKMGSSSSKEHEAARGDTMTSTQSNDHTVEDPSAQKKQMADKKAEGSVGVENESLVSVSWRVPKNKRGEEHPGFNLDYAPPEEHPPSHNR